MSRRKTRPALTHFPGMARAWMPSGGNAGAVARRPESAKEGSFSLGYFSLTPGILPSPFGPASLFHAHLRMRGQAKEK